MGRPTAYMLGRIRALIDAHSQALENFMADGGDDPYPNAEGGWTYQLGGTGAASYSSYFKLVNASEGDVCSIGVTDGGWLGVGAPTNCGTTYINGTYIEIPVFTKPLGAEGIYHVWLHYWVANVVEEEWVVGENAEIIVGDVGEDQPPDDPHSGIAYASRLLGRVAVAKDDNDKLSISQITQDYLQGGEYIGLLFGDCLGNAIVEEEPE